MSLQNTGERQVAITVDGIANDHRKRYEFAREMIPNLVENHEIARVLDAGCGIGYGAFIMANNYSGISVVGCDNSDEAIGFAIKNYNIGSVEFHSMTIFDAALEFEYNIVTAFEIIEHVEDDLENLKKLSLKTEHIICSVPNQNVIPFSKETHPFHIRHYTANEFRELLLESGFNSIKMYTQYDKHDGTLYDGDDGRTLIAVAKVAK